jgi:hypothetical protein
MSEPTRVFGPKRFLRPRKQYTYVSIEHDGVPLAHVFVAPQELSGLEMGYIDPDDDEEYDTVGGDVMIGNPEDGYYTIAFETTNADGSFRGLLLGENDYKLQDGAAFVIKPGYGVSQLHCQSKDEALAVLP